MNKTHKLSGDRIESIVNEYKDGLTVRELSEKYSVSTVCIYYYLKKFNIITRKSDGRKDKSINEDYFGEIDTPGKAYILGFIMADGCISTSSKRCNKPNRLSINISEKDVSILEFIKFELNTDAKIEYLTPKGSYSNGEMSRLVINSTQICSDLCRLGVIERKTGYEYISDEIKKSPYLPDFIRGFFDGDGSTINSIGSKISFFSFCSGKRMIEDIVEVLRCIGLDGALTVTRDKRHDNVYEVNIFKYSDTMKFISYIYDGGGFFLARKKNKIRQLQKG